MVGSRFLAASFCGEGKKGKGKEESSFCEQKEAKKLHQFIAF
jgi:hypothetical protein